MLKLCILLMIVGSSPTTSRLIENWREKQSIISHAINTIMKQSEWSLDSALNSSITSPPLYTSHIHDICHGLHGHSDHSRLACCQPQDARHLYNIKIENGAFTFYGDAPISPLPEIRSLVRHTKPPSFFRMKIYRKRTTRFTDESSSCKAVFNGTLHIFGRSVGHNVYHAVSDSFLPLAGQFLLDAHMASPFTHLPRLFLSELTQDDHLADESSFPNVTTHLDLTRQLFSAGHASIRNLEGHCFRRVVWGGGVRFMYHDMLTAIRRETTDFARLLVMGWYGGVRDGAREGSRTASSSTAISTTASPASITPPTSSLRAVLYTRGSVGTGRSLANEQLIISHLRLAGYDATLCCDYHSPSSVRKQLMLAVEADVVIGIHGAALVHAVFAPRRVVVIELKTAYGYTNSLFALVADGRQGQLGHIDIREYVAASGGKSRPVDQHLAERVVGMAARGVDARMGRAAATGSGKDFLFSSVRNNNTASTSTFASSSIHYLGPPLEALKTQCRSSDLHRYQLSLGAGRGFEELHCNDFCKAFVDADSS